MSIVLLALLLWLVLSGVAVALLAVLFEGARRGPQAAPSVAPAADEPVGIPLAS